jgi:predicted RNA-binding Zn ribbon-like protein
VTDGRNESKSGRNTLLYEALLVDFLNTVDVEEGTDALDTPSGLHEWADLHGVKAGDHEETLKTRDALRSLVMGEQPELPTVSLTPSCAGGGVSLRSDTAAEAALAAALTLSIQGRISRVKLCQSETCRVAYYDHSRNGSRAWCSMEVCGNRAKARAFRASRQA